MHRYPEALRATGVGVFEQGALERVRLRMWDETAPREGPAPGVRAGTGATKDPA